MKSYNNNNLNGNMIANNSIASDHMLASLHFNIQHLTNLKKCIDLIRSGSLKTSSRLLIESIKSTNNQHMNRIIIDCQRLGLLVQAYKFISKGNKLMLEKDYTKALIKYKKVDLRDITKDLAFQLLHNNGVCYAMLDRYNDAIPFFQHALLLIPKNYLTMESFAFVKMLMCDYEDALDMFTVIIGMDNIHPYRLLSILYGSAECRLHLTGCDSTSSVIEIKNKQSLMNDRSHYHPTSNNTLSPIATLIANQVSLRDYHLSPHSQTSPFSNDNNINDININNNEITEWCINPMRTITIVSSEMHQEEEEEVVYANKVHSNTIEDSNHYIKDSNYTTTTAINITSNANNTTTTNMNNNTNSNTAQSKNITMNDIEVEAMQSPNYFVHSKNKRDQLRNALQAYQHVSSMYSIASSHEEVVPINSNNSIIESNHNNRSEERYLSAMKRKLPEYASLINELQSATIRSGNNHSTNSSSVNRVNSVDNVRVNNVNPTSYLKNVPTQTVSSSNNNNLAYINSIEQQYYLPVLQRNTAITTVFTQADKPMRPTITNVSNNNMSDILSIKNPQQQYRDTINDFNSNSSNSNNIINISNSANINTNNSNTINNANIINNSNNDKIFNTKTIKIVPPNYKSDPEITPHSEATAFSLKTSSLFKEVSLTETTIDSDSSYDNNNNNNNKITITEATSGTSPKLTKNNTSQVCFIATNNANSNIIERNNIKPIDTSMLNTNNIEKNITIPYNTIEDISKLSTSITNATTDKNVHYKIIPDTTDETQYKLDQNRLLDQKRYVDAYIFSSSDLINTTTTTDPLLSIQSTSSLYNYSTSNVNESYLNHNCNESYSYNELLAPGPYPSNVDIRHRELYLSDKSFEEVLNIPKNRWKHVPLWKKVSLKKQAGLF